MPRVPLYSVPTEQREALATPTQRAIVTPALLSVGANTQLLAGAGLMSAGRSFNDVAVRAQERENADQLFRAETTLRDEYIKYEEEVRKSRTGRFAVGLTGDTDKWWQDTEKKVGEGLTNDVQRRMFAQKAAQLRQGSVQSMARYEAEQRERSHDEAWLASKGATISGAAANPTPESVDAARAELDRKNRYQAARRGWEPEQLEAEKRRDLTALHKNVIQQLARVDPAAATAYFEKYKDEIDGTQQAEIGAFAERVTAARVGEATADAAWAKLGPKSDTAPMELDKMEASIRETLKNNEPAMKQAIAALRERAQAHTTSRKERDNALEAEVNKAILSGASRRQITSMPAFHALSPETARKLDSFLENRDYTRSARAAADEARADAAERRKDRARHAAAIDAALRVSDPDVLVSMSRDEVINLLPSLGAEHTAALVQRWDTLTKNPAKLTEARIDKEDFETVASEFGLRPFEKNKSEAEKEQLVRLQSHVERVIGVEQAARGKPLTREEKGALMRRELDNKVFLDQWFRDPSVALPLVKPDDMESAYVMVGDRQVYLKDIPAADRAEIIRKRQAAKLPITEQHIAEMWVRAQARGGAGITSGVPQ